MLPSVDVALVAFLQLAISVKNEHYQALQQARVGQLKDVFAAKLGWLTGSQYSRVATTDIDEINGVGSAANLVKELFGDYVDKESFWLSNKRLKIFEGLLSRELEDLGVDSLSQPQAAALVTSVPIALEELADVVVNLTSQIGAVISPEKLSRLRSQILNSRKLKNLLLEAQS